jgi:hypothetical protein
MRSRRFKFICYVTSRIGGVFLVLGLLVSFVVGGAQALNGDRALCVQTGDFLFDTSTGLQFQRHHTTFEDTSDAANKNVPGYTTVGELTQSDKTLISPDGQHTAAIVAGTLVITDHTGEVEESLPAPPEYSLFRWSPANSYLSLIHLEPLSSMSNNAFYDDIHYRFDVVNLKTRRWYGATADIIFHGSDSITMPELAQWSNDGHAWLFVQQINATFDTKRKLMRLDADTGIITPLTGDDLTAPVVMSPAGRYVAVVRKTSDGDDLVDIIDTDTGDVKPMMGVDSRMVVVVYNKVYNLPHWTPDGAFVAVEWGLVTANGTAAVLSPDTPVFDQGGITWMHPDGSDRREYWENISRGGAVQDVPMPTGTWAAFAISTAPADTYTDIPPQAEIDLVNLQTGNGYAIVQNMGSISGGWSVLPAPDGGAFAIANVDSVLSHTDAEPFTLTVFTPGQTTQTTYYASHYDAMAWSSDGSWVAYTSEEGINATFNVIRRDGSRVMRRVIGQTADLYGRLTPPVWSQCG